MRAVIITLLAAVSLVVCAAASPAGAPCDAALQPVNDLLQKAETALQGNDVASAATAYDAAMTQLAAVSWSPPDATCDANRYRFEKVLATIRSLSSAIRLNRIEPKAAHELDSTLLGEAYSLTGEKSKSNTAAAEYFRGHYRDLYDLYGTYLTQMNDAGRSRVIALHNPTSASCTNPDVPPETLALTDTATEWIVRNHGHLPPEAFGAAAEVHLSADGTVEAVNLSRSSGYKDLDDAILHDARGATYLPEVANCKRVPSVYVYKINVSTGF